MHLFKLSSSFAPFTQPQKQSGSSPDSPSERPKRSKTGMYKDENSGWLSKKKRMLQAFASIQAFLFVIELGIMFMLDALGITEKFPQGYLMNNLLDSTALVLGSSPFIWWALNRYGKAMESKESAEQSLALLQRAFENSSESFMIADGDGHILNINPAFTKVTGYTFEEVIGQNPRILRSGQHGEDFYSEMWDAINNDGLWQGEIWNKRKNGEIYPEWLTICRIGDETNQLTHHIAVFTDITVHKKMEQSLHQMANFDVLTGLPNREFLYEQMNSAFVRVNSRNGKLALVFFDLDRFKHVNETFGHKIGDELLQVVAERISSCVQPGDTVCRLGGDEFIILLESLNSDEEVSQIANRILTAIAKPFRIQDYEMHMTASLGICMYPDDGADRMLLMKNADTALYKAIESGGNCFKWYVAEMNSSALDRLNMENALRHAIEREELHLYYQPQVTTLDRCIIGVEALIRWHHPELGVIPPSVFIPIAEENGMIIDIGDWVLQTACRQAREWKDAGYNIRMGVNISPRQFHQANIREKILGVLDETGLDPRQLEIEITESMVMGNPEKAIILLKELQAIGILIAMDDFGTGHSSLALLKNFPIDTLKIDQSFVRDIFEGSDGAAIAATIVTLAHRMKMKAIAEGVETVDQLEFMESHCCNEIQGYLFSNPLPKDELELLLRRKGSLIPIHC